ncbi:DUF11 domain-containing protein [Photobacterium toruni]|uniref:DUF11 domain-containing protein n=1 Tax=Photobacterium toruni TaxID=1935446 RepID=UPI002E16EC87|nr:DUF11 domain-containing protein [Photobacterium toruni]
MLKSIGGFLIFSVLNLTSYSVFSSSFQHVALTKTVTNISQHSESSTLVDAKPGDIIEYNIYITNSSSHAISNINIFASVPRFTTLVTTINCNDGYLPSVLNCQILTPNGFNRSGYQGEITWQLLGKLEAGITAQVSYQVTIK